jgi:predicted component of type VI protein secretion system
MHERMDGRGVQDGSTRVIAQPGDGSRDRSYLARHRVLLVALSRDLAGSEFPLDQERVLLGRGPGVDLAFNDVTMSRQHAVLELSAEGFRVRDLGSTNGVLVNGTRVPAADLKHADVLGIGEHEFQVVIEARERPAPTHDLSGS